MKAELLAHFLLLNLVEVNLILYFCLTNAYLLCLFY